MSLTSEQQDSTGRVPGSGASAVGGPVATFTPKHNVQEDKLSYSAMRRKRFTAGVLAGAMALTVTPILGLTGTAGALEPATGDGSVCEDAPNAEPFTDVSDADPSQAEIECLVNTGITTGVTATTYEPNSPVTRRQMALFLVRLADVIEENAVEGEITPLPDGDGDTDFTDIADEAAEIQAAIDRLADSNIALGTTDTTFSPAANVTRRQMAKFIVRLQEFMAGEEATPENPDDAFDDDNGDNGEEALNILAAEGVFLGDGQGNVNPGDDISRRQMANVIIRKLQYHFEQGDITRLFAEDDGNQDFTADQQQVIRQLGGTQGSGTGGVVEYRFSGLDAARDYDVALVQCGDDDEGPDVMLNGGFASFADQDLNDEADGLGNTQDGNAIIATVGFSLINAQYADDVSPEANGTLLVRVDSEYADCAYVVVFDDNADDDTLDLVAATTNSYNTAADAVGVAGPVVWHFGEAPTGTNIDGEVLYVDKEANFFVLDNGWQYLYSSEDTGYYDGAEVDYALTFNQFESYLSIGDYLYEQSAINTGNYSRTNPNQFQFDDDTVNRPSGLTLAVADADAGGVANDIVVTWTAPSPMDGDVDEYCVQLHDATTLATVGFEECTDEVNTAGTGDAPTTLTINNVADASYVARVYADSETDDSSYWSNLSNVVASGAPADTTRPTITDARVTVDANLQDEVDATDQIRLTFSEDMADNLDTTGVFVLTDVDGDTFTLDCSNAANATCALTDDGLNVDRILTITVVAVTDSNAGGDGVLEYPANITTTNAAVADQAGNVVNLATSTDVAVDKEA